MSSSSAFCGQIALLREVEGYLELCDLVVRGLRLGIFLSALLFRWNANFAADLMEVLSDSAN